MSTLKVYCDDVINHPHCIHGPSLLFSRLVKGNERKFYACSACRDRKDCSFFMWEDEKISEKKLLIWKRKEFETFSYINHRKIYLKLCRFKCLPLKQRKFCHTCFAFIFPTDTSHHNDHILTENISNKLLNFPSLLIKPIESDKKEAQYWFTESSKQFIVNTIKSIGLLSCLCIGTPTVHELLRETKIKSLLLDFDKRYYYFYDENEFCLFNMFNCYLMGKNEISIKVLEKSLNSSLIGVIIDPPFGARIEPLAYTVNSLQKKATSKLNIFLILPYFMETNVIKHFPDFIMLDYQIQYMNHSKFHNKKSVKKPSPIRIFTNVSSNLIEMPISEGYYYCKECQCWRSKNNKHCSICKICPSKNGDRYIHCRKCLKCVKHTWNHCLTCDHCVIPGHKCNKQNNSRKRTVNEYSNISKFNNFHSSNKKKKKKTKP